MKQKTYSIATPSFISSKKDYHVKAFLRNLKSKVYGIRLNLVTPFLDNKKDYPIRLSASSRLPGIVDEEVSEVAERVRTVDTVLSRYVEGIRMIEEKGAIVQDIQFSTRRDTWRSIVTELVDPLLSRQLDAQIISTMDFTEKEIDYFMHIMTTEVGGWFARDMEILESYKAMINHEYTIDITQDVEGRMETKTYHMDVLQDETAVKLLTILNGRSFVDQLRAEVARKEVESRFVRFETAKIIERVLNALYAEFVEFETQGMPTYLPELIVANKVKTDISILLPDYELSDFFFNPIESRMFDIEFYKRKQDIMPDGVMFSDYDYAVHNMTYESNSFHEHFDLFDRVVEVLEGRFYFTEEGMRQKYLTPVDEVRFLPEIDESVRLHLELDVRHLDYEFALKPKIVESRYDQGYELVDHNMEYLSTSDNGYDTANHNMEYTSTFDDGMDYANHNMTYESRFYEWFDHGVQAENEGKFFEEYELATSGKTIEGRFEDFVEFKSRGIPTYIPELEFGSRVTLQIGGDPMDAPIQSNRRDLWEAFQNEAFSHAHRMDLWNATSYTFDLLNRVNTFLTNIDETDLSGRVDMFDTVAEQFLLVDRADEFITHILEDDIFFRRNEQYAGLNVHMVDGSTRINTWDMEYITEQHSLNRNRLMDHESYIVEGSSFDIVRPEFFDTLLQDLDSAKVDDEFTMEYIITTFPSTLVEPTYNIDINEMSEFTLRTHIKDAGFIHEFTNFNGLGRPTYMHDFDLFGLVKEDYEGHFVNEIDESFRPDTWASKIIEQFQFHLIKDDYTGYIIENDAFAKIRPEYFESMFFQDLDGSFVRDVFGMEIISTFDMDVVRPEYFDVRLQDIDKAYVRDEFFMDIDTTQPVYLVPNTFDARDIGFEYNTTIRDTWDSNIITTFFGVEKDVDYASSIIGIDESTHNPRGFDATELIIDDMQRVGNIHGYTTDITSSFDTTLSDRDNIIFIDTLQEILGRVNEHEGRLEEFTDAKMGVYATYFHQFEEFTRNNLVHGSDVIEFEDFIRGYELDVSLSDFVDTNRADTFFTDIQEIYQGFRENEFMFDITSGFMSSRVDTFETTTDESTGTRRVDTFDTWIDESDANRRVDTFETWIEESTGQRRVDIFETWIDESSADRRVDVFDISIDDATGTRRVDTFFTDLNESTGIGRVDTFITVLEELGQYGRVETFDGLITETYLSHRDDIFGSTILELTDIRERRDRISEIIDSLLGYRDNIHNALAPDEMTDAAGDYIPVSLAEYDLFNRSDVFRTEIDEILEVYRQQERDTFLEEFLLVTRSDTRETFMDDFTFTQRAGTFSTILDEHEFARRDDEAISYVTSTFELSDKVRERDSLMEEITDVARSNIFETLVQEGSLADRRIEWFTVNHAEFELGNRSDVFSTTIDTSYLVDRADEFVTSIEELQFAYRVDEFNATTEDFDLFTRVVLTGRMLDSMELAHRQDTLEVGLSTFIDALRSDEFSTTIEDANYFTKASDFITTIEDYYFGELGNDYEFVIDELTTVHDKAAGITDIITVFDALHNVRPKDATMDEMENGDTTYLPSILAEWDLATRIVEDKISSIAEFESNVFRVDTFTTLLDGELSGSYRVDTFYTSIDETTGIYKVDEYESSIDETSGDLRVSEFETSIDETLGINRVDTFATDLNEFWLGDRVRDFMSVVENTTMSQRADEWSVSLQDFFLADRLNTHDTSGEEFDLFTRILQEGTRPEEIHWFTRIVRDITAPEEFDLFNRVVVDINQPEEFDLFGRVVREMTQPEEIDWFTRTVQTGVIEELDWFGRTIQDADIIETIKTNRNMVYNTSIDEFEGFFGPTPEEYTWLWHSRPQWWNSWTWKKTK